MDNKKWCYITTVVGGASSLWSYHQRTYNQRTSEQFLIPKSFNFFCLMSALSGQHLVPQTINLVSWKLSNYWSPQSVVDIIQELHITTSLLAILMYMQLKILWQVLFLLVPWFMFLMPSCSISFVGAENYGLLESECTWLTEHSTGNGCVMYQGKWLRRSMCLW